MALVEAARFYSGAEAAVARSALDAAGIDSVAFDGQINAYTGGGMTPVRLMVLEEQLGHARRILDVPGE